MRPVRFAGSCWILGSLAFALSAIAGERLGISLPDTVRVKDKTLVLNGMGVREATIFNVKVYVAGLYLEAKSSAAEAILNSSSLKRTEVVFLRDVSADKQKEVWEESFEKNCGKSCESSRESLRKLQGLMKDVKEGERLVFEFSPKGLRVLLPSPQTIADPEFAKIVLASWLGPKPPNESLKTGLLGGN